MRVGILGYGNLGRALAKGIKNTDHTLVAVFSRRKIYEEKIKILPRAELEGYTRDIDVMLIATSSHSDARADAKFLLPHFNTLDSFDNHKLLPSYLSEIKPIAEAYKMVAITAAGWDPGLLSLGRAMANISVGAENQNTFWGVGKSLGHSSLLMSIDGVKYAAQYTVPNSESIALSKNTDAALTDTDRHFRECFIVPEQGADKRRIESAIKSADGYFKDYNIVINFITEDEFLSKHRRDFHAGEVIATSIKDEKKTAFDLRLDIPSNAIFTARIMISYLNAIDYLQKNGFFGAYTPLDIPMSLLISGENYNKFI